MAGVEDDLEAQAQIVRRDIQVCADLLQPVAHRNHPVTCVSPFREIRWQADTVIANINDDLAGYKRVVGYVPEEANLYPFLSGLEYLELTGRLRALPSRLIEKRAGALLKLFSMHAYRHTAISTYSKGMRQRILLISALLHNPELMIFDEPLSGLDVTSALIFKSLVSALSRTGKMIFYCSHVLETVEKVCSHVIILQKGKQIAYASVDELKRLQSTPSLEAAFSHVVQETGVEEAANAIVDAVVTA